VDDFSDITLIIAAEQKVYFIDLTFF